MEGSVLSREIIGSQNDESLVSGVSWAAVTGGAFVLSASWLILLALGAGMGLSTVSPWHGDGSKLATLTIVWLIVTEVLASSLGGYITGRLRTKWAVVHSDEVYFRDTANGFLAWSVALVLSVTVLASAAAYMVGGAVAQTPPREGSNIYLVDKLFRTANGGPERADSVNRAEAAAILAHALRSDQPVVDDQNYLATVVSARTGLSAADAQKRVTDVVAEARQAADTVRSETARLLLWLFLSLSIGAFCASYAATIGGRQRDHVRTV